MKCPNCKMEHERGISYCSNCGSYIPGNAATPQTETPNALSQSPYKVTTGLVFAIIANVILEIAAIILSVASIVLETPNPDLSVVQSSSVVTMLISVIALIMGIKSISTYKKAAAAGGKKPIPAFILGIIATVGASALILSCLFVLALLSIV